MDLGDVRYRPETGCAAQADLRGDALMASAPPAERWLLIESRSAWPRQALTSLQDSSSGVELGDAIARRCRELRIRPVLIRRYGRSIGLVPGGGDWWTAALDANSSAGVICRRTNTCWTSSQARIRDW